MRASKANFTTSSLAAGRFEQIARKSNEVIRLPERHSISPAELPDSSHLDRIFSEKSIDHFISIRLRPDISDASLLTPSRFRVILMALRSSLRSRVRSNPRSARQFGRLAAILDEERDLVDLLQMYRSALLQG
jgi:type III secretion protein X